MNWTPSNIFDHKGKELKAKNGTVKAQINFTGGGWRIHQTTAGETQCVAENIDVWVACSILNNLEAKP